MLLGSVSPGAWAQDQDGISLGQMNLLLTAGLTWGHDDNVTFAQAGKEIDSNFYVFSPGIRLEAPSNRSLFALQLSGEKGEYDDSPADDYSDWTLRGSWDFDPSSRTSMGLFGEMQEGHDRRGQGRSQGDLGLAIFDADEYDLDSFGGYFTYGAIGSRGRLELEAAFSDRQYTNNRDITQFLDRDQNRLEGTFFVRIRPKTSLLFGLGKSEIDYARRFTDGTSFDSDEKRYFFGVTWDVSARTSGRIDIGKLEKDFVDPLKTGYDDDFYRVGIDWQPRTYSTFNLSALKQTTEAQFLGDYVLREDISLSWTHYW
ncbi:MAG: outer membrane beta-barrel protein, partial [Xanthomonadales bacterium]|nr:outer membrane beta-barrel protein [Xanthomonadales bacterium]